MRKTITVFGSSIPHHGEEQFSVAFTDDERDNAVTAWIEYVLVYE